MTSPDDLLDDVRTEYVNGKMEGTKRLFHRVFPEEYVIFQRSAKKLFDKTYVLQIAITER